ncbi:MAG: 50S ribosomal protein L10 [Phycisphaerae bacterium]|nr:50S ribosomal protein L10 [Phycisphaerae bacterium]
MSKPMKEMMSRVFERQFEDVQDAVLIDIRGVEANDNNAFRAGLAGKDIRVTVVKNSLARKVFAGGGLEPLTEHLQGPSAVAYGGESVVNVARELVDWAKKVANLELKAAVMEGTVFGPGEVEKLSKFPTRDEAQAQVIQLVLSPAGNVISAANSAGGNVAGILKTMIETLEKGESISKVA